MLGNDGQKWSKAPHFEGEDANAMNEFGSCSKISLVCICISYKKKAKVTIGTKLQNT